MTYPHNTQLDYFRIIDNPEVKHEKGVQELGTLTRRVTLFLSPALSRCIVPPMLNINCRSLLQAFGIASIGHLLPVLLHEKGVLCELRGECYFSS